MSQLVIDSPRSMFEYMMHHTAPVYDRPIRIENMYYPRFCIGNVLDFTLVVVDTTFQTNDIHALFKFKNLSDKFRFSKSYKYYIIYKMKTVDVQDEVKDLYQNCESNYGMSASECVDILMEDVQLLVEANPLIVKDAQQQCMFVKYSLHKSKYELWLTFISTIDEACGFRNPRIGERRCKSALQNAFVKLFELFEQMNLKIELHLYDDAYAFLKESGEKIKLFDERMRKQSPYKDISIYSKFGAKFQKSDISDKFRELYAQYTHTPTDELFKELKKLADRLKVDMTVDSSNYSNYSWCSA